MLGEKNIAPKLMYHFECFDAEGNLKWQETIHNVVTTLGKNDVLNKYFSNSAPGIPYLGLISSVSYTTGPAAGDTMSSHSGWTEAGNANAPTYTSPRKTMTAAWGAASGGSMVSSAQSFAITGSGTIKGAFLNIGGTSAIDNTTGLLYSAATFSNGDKVVASSDTVNVTVTLNA